MSLSPIVVRTTHSSASREEFFSLQTSLLSEGLGMDSLLDDLVERYTLASLTEISDVLAQPTLSLTRVIYIILSEVPPLSPDDTALSGDDEGKPTKKTTKKKKPTRQDDQIQALPADTWVRVWTMRTIDDVEASLITGLGGVIEVDQELSRSEVIATLRSLLPGVSAEVVRTMETYPLSEIVSMAEYLHLGYAADASHLTPLEVQVLFPQESSARSYELLDKLLSRDMMGAIRLYEELTTAGSLWMLIPTMRTQLRRYLAALHLLETQIAPTRIESLIGVKVFVLDRLRRSRITSQKMAILVAGLHDIHRSMITGQFSGKSEAYVLVRLISLFSQG